MGKPHCRRKGTDLTYRVISVEQGKPVSLLERGSEAARPIDGEAGNRSEKKRISLCNGADLVCRLLLEKKKTVGLSAARAGAGGLSPARPRAFAWLVVRAPRRVGRAARRVF